MTATLSIIAFSLLVTANYIAGLACTVLVYIVFQKCREYGHLNVTANRALEILDSKESANFSHRTAALMAQWEREKSQKALTAPSGVSYREL